MKMDPAVIVEISRDAVFTLLSSALPTLLVAMGVGLVISLLQALTQIQEPTLSFVPKIIAVFFVLLLSLPFIGGNLSRFSEQIMTTIVHISDK